MSHDRAGNIEAIGDGAHGLHGPDLLQTRFEGFDHRGAVLALNGHHPRETVTRRIDHPETDQFLEGLPDPHQTGAAAGGVEDPVGERVGAALLEDLQPHGFLALEPAGFEEGRHVDIRTRCEFRGHIVAHLLARRRDVRSVETDVGSEVAGFPVVEPVLIAFRHVDKAAGEAHAG